MEYSEFREGDLPCVCAKGGRGELGIEIPLLEDNFLLCEKPEP